MPEGLLKANEKDLSKLYCDLASLPCAGFTAHELVCCKLKLPIFKNENVFLSSNFFQRKNVLVAGGAGGVGGYCVQLLKLWRATFNEKEQQEIKIIATCSKKHVDYVKSLGATHVIDYQSENIDEAIKKITNGELIDIWIDTVSKESVE